MKFVALALVAVFGLTGVAACGSGAHNYNLECDVPGDYFEHDSDCGYVDSSGVWHYYSWSSPYKTTLFS